MNLIFSIMELIGGLLCCVGDILFDLNSSISNLIICREFYLYN